MNQNAKRFNYQIADRVYVVEVRPLNNNQSNIFGYLISIYYQDVLIGDYQFIKNIVSYEFFGGESEIMEYLFNYTKGFIDGWDNYRRTNFKF